jgi:hypothetical protein
MVAPASKALRGRFKAASSGSQSRLVTVGRRLLPAPVVPPDGGGDAGSARQPARRPRRPSAWPTTDLTDWKKGLQRLEGAYSPYILRSYEGDFRLFVE